MHLVENSKQFSKNNFLLNLKKKKFPLFLNKDPSKQYITPGFPIARHFQSSPESHESIFRWAAAVLNDLLCHSMQHWQ